LKSKRAPQEGAIIKKLDHRESNLVNEIMANPGLTETAVFEKCGLTHGVGRRLLKKDNVKAELQDRRESMALACQISLRSVMLEETCIAHADPVDLFSDDGSILSPNMLPERIRRAISSIEVIELPVKVGDEQKYKYKYKFWDKGKSLERISKHLGLYEKDNVQKAIRMYFMRSDDENAPQIEDDPEIVDAEIVKLTGKKPIALLE